MLGAMTRGLALVAEDRIPMGVPWLAASPKPSGALRQARVHAAVTAVPTRGFSSRRLLASGNLRHAS
jgi:hypothetical protein